MPSEITDSEAFELGNKLYANITSNANNIIKTNDYIEFVKFAINALEKQEKIKEVFTHYAFSGNELDVLNDCISALSEIKAILKE